MDKGITERSIESFRKDARFRAIALSCVSQAMDEHGQVDPERAAQAASDIALSAVTTLLQRIYEEDAELSAMRAEMHRFRDLALEALKARPATIFYGTSSAIHHAIPPKM